MDISHQVNSNHYPHSNSIPSYRSLVEEYHGDLIAAVSVHGVIGMTPGHRGAVGLRLQLGRGGARRATVLNYDRMHRASVRRQEREVEEPGRLAAVVAASRVCEYLPMCVACTSYTEARSR